MVENILPIDPFTMTLGWGQNSTIAEYGHVAYQIKGIDACGNMVANILHAERTPNPGDGIKSSKFNFFRTWSC